MQIISGLVLLLASVPFNLLAPHRDETETKGAAWCIAKR